MFKNYLIIASRILLRKKRFSLINILGLAIGMAACLLIVQYISFELSYDKFHQNAGNLYRVKHQSYNQGNLIENLPKTYSAVGPALKNDFPEVKEITRISKLSGLVTARQPNGSQVAFNEGNLYRAESSFLKVFSFPMLQGSTDALKNPNGVVITEKTAEKYFPGQDAIGKTIKIQQQISGTDITRIVTGVCKNVPANSQLQFDFLVASDPKEGDWIYPDSYTYVLLSPQTDAKTFEAKLPRFMKKYINGNVSNSSPTQGKTNLTNLVFTLQPLLDVHLYSNLSEEISNGGNGNLIWYLGLIATLILIIAYINYVNLSTAGMIDRAKEVGVRKVLGSQRAQLVIQFLFESMLLNLAGIAVAIFVVLLAMPWFSKLCGVQMSFTLWQNPVFLFAFVGCLLLGILASALYPALVLSNYKPVQILKGKFMSTGEGIPLRKILVVFQFVATIAFMIGTLVVYQQVNYMKTANKGMDMSKTLIVMAPQNVRPTDQDMMAFTSRDSVFQTELTRNPTVQSVTSSSSIPGQSIDYVMSYTRRTPAAGEKSLRLSTLEIGEKFIDQFKVKVVAGDKLSQSKQYNKPPMMLNEAAVVSLGFKNSKDAIGKIVETKNGRGRVFENEVVGVIQNFHQTSLKDAFTPTVIRMIDPSSVTHYEVKINSNDMARSIALIQKTYQNVFPDSAFDYFFLDEFFDQQYKVEQHFGQAFSLFAGFAIFVACLGLFGLTLITISQRIKEIGIRKVLGASVNNILILLSKDFMGLILIANMIALPIAYWGCYRWLQNYQFRIDFSIWFFVLPMLMVCLIALITISTQAIKAALSNPVKSLRTE